jgi:hypothetical protein
MKMIKIISAFTIKGKAFPIWQEARGKTDR